jgi:protein ImuA
LILSENRNKTETKIMISLSSYRSTFQETALFPEACSPLEEVAAAAPADVAASLGFALSRLAADRTERRAVVLVTTAAWVRDRGRPYGLGLSDWGLAAGRLLWVRAERDGDALWALEEALKSGAVAGGLATVATPSFVATHRLDAAARAGRVVGILLRGTSAGDLSAARRRWRVAAGPSSAADFDRAAPGAVRLRAELTRSRNGLPNGWELERDDETGGLRVVAGLADHGMATVASGRRGVAA